jgi:hypothetical protein
MGDAKRRKEIGLACVSCSSRNLKTAKVLKLDTAKASTQSDKKWQGFGHSVDSKDLFLDLIESLSGAEQPLWREWEENSEKFTTSQVVGIFHANYPRITEVTINFFTYKEFVLQSSAYGVSKAMLSDFESFFRVFDSGLFRRTKGCLPPFLVVWYDGKPDGDFVSQPCLLVPSSLVPELPHLQLVRVR